MSEDFIREASEQYLHTLEAIGDKQVRACISVKPTQLGLTISSETCLRSLEEIVGKAYGRENFVWIDVEGSKYTDDTLNLYRMLKSNYPNVGVAVQAYLKRTFEDVRVLGSVDGIVRLCKGAYNEPKEIAFKREGEIKKNFSRTMRKLFEDGRKFAVATHDTDLIDEAIVLSQKFPANCEFQMLMGIRDDLKIKLSNEGFRVKEYIHMASIGYPIRSGGSEKGRETSCCSYALSSRVDHIKGITL